MVHENIKIKIDTIILEWVKMNCLIPNFNQEIENYIYYLKHETSDKIALDYLNYKLNIWNCIEVSKTLNR